MHSQVPRVKSDVIAAGREIVAESGLYNSKKRYAALVYDVEGFRSDTDGKLRQSKSNGLGLAYVTRPCLCKNSPSEVLMMVLQETPRKQILDRITDFPETLNSGLGFEKGAPKRANKIGHLPNLKKARQSKHVRTSRASINWNTLKRMNGDKYPRDCRWYESYPCKLKQNP